MNRNMDTEGPPQKKEEFLFNLRSELERMEADRLIIKEQAVAKLKAAENINSSTLPEDLGAAARQFALAGTGGELEMNQAISTGLLAEGEVELSRQQQFLSALSSALNDRVSQGRLSRKKADEKLDIAQRIEPSTLPTDLYKAAEIFAASGNSTEQEMIQLLKDLNTGN